MLAQRQRAGWQVSNASLAPIRIFVHGVEMKGDVEIKLVEPELTKARAS